MIGNQQAFSVLAQSSSRANAGLGRGGDVERALLKLAMMQSFVKKGSGRCSEDNVTNQMIKMAELCDWQYCFCWDQLAGAENDRHFPCD